MEVGQREGEDEALRREGEPARPDLKVQLPARACVDRVGRERLSAATPRPTIACSSVKGTGPTSPGGVSAPVISASTPHTL